MTARSPAEIAEITFKADFLSKTFLNRLHARGLKGEALKRAFADCLPEMPAILRAGDELLAARRRQRSAAGTADDALSPSSLTDVHPDIEPEIVRWAFEQVALLLVRETPESKDGEKP